MLFTKNPSKPRQLEFFRQYVLKSMVGLKDHFSTKFGIRDFCEFEHLRSHAWKHQFQAIGYSFKSRW